MYLPSKSVLKAQSLSATLELLSTLVVLRWNCVGLRITTCVFYELSVLGAVCINYDTQRAVRGHRSVEEAAKRR